MSEPFESKPFHSSDPMTRLSEAIREMKNANADRGDVVVELREATRMRLELLAQELTDVFEEVPAEDDQFDFAISSGLQPRLWIDSTAHVAMGRDRRSYRFVRDTRNGRVVIIDSHDMKAVADKVTRYIAERMLERRAMLEGEVAGRAHGEPSMLRDFGPILGGGSWGLFFTVATLVLLGIVLGVAGALIWLWDKFPPPVTP